MLETLLTQAGGSAGTLLIAYLVAKRAGLLNGNGNKRMDKRFDELENNHFQEMNSKLDRVLYVLEDIKDVLKDLRDK